MSDSTKYPFHKRIDPIYSQIFLPWTHSIPPIHIWREDGDKFNLFFLMTFLNKVLIAWSSADG